MVNKDLKALCKQRDLPQSGNKDQLIDRLKLSDNPPPKVEEYVPSLDDTKQVFEQIKVAIEKWGPILFLGHTLLKKEHGKRHGSMGTGATEEDLWTTAFSSMKISDFIECTQSDVGIICSHRTLPVSIKTLSSIGSTMAVNWGKNKILIQFQFLAPIMMIYHRPEKPTKQDMDIKSGVYLIEPSWCQQNISLKSNNKSDYTINVETARKMIRHSIDTCLYQTVIPKRDEGTHCVFRNPHNRTTEVIKMPTADMMKDLRS